jgi:integrase
VNAWGKPFASSNAFGNWFRNACDEAGLKTLAAHGLRKAAARRMAEAGCTSKQIAAITGHKTLSEIERYTEAAEQEHLARTAMERIDDD